MVGKGTRPTTEGMVFVQESDTPQELQIVLEIWLTVRRPQRTGTSTPKAMTRLRAIKVMPKRTGEPRNTTINSEKTQRMAPSTKHGEKY